MNIGEEYERMYGEGNMDVDPMDVILYDEVGNEIEEAKNPPFTDWEDMLAAEEHEDDAPVTREEAAARDPIGGESEPKKSRKKGSRQKDEYFTFTIQLGKNAMEATTRVDIFRRTLLDLREKKEIGFYACGHEVAPTTGQHHIQGYLETYSNKIRWSFATFREKLCENLPKVLNPRTHKMEEPCWVRKSQGSAEQNKVYTQKDCDKGNWFEVNAEFPYRNYGRGNQLGRVKEVLDSGATLIAAAQTTGCFDSIMRFKSSLLWYSEMTAPKRNHITNILWIHGPSGAGKSTFARKTFPGAYWLDPPKNGSLWWDGYDRHTTVVIDDIGPCTLGAGHAGFEYAKRLFDSSPLQVGVHGGKVQFVATKIVITANFPPQEWMLQQYCGYAWDATNPLFRRFTDFGTVVLFGTDDEEYDRPTKLGANGQAAHYVDGGLGEYLRLQMVAPLEPAVVAPKTKKGYRAHKK